MKLLLISGSQRRASYNSRLLGCLAQRFEGSARLDWLLPAEVGLPIFDQDLELEPQPQLAAARLHARIAAADALVVATPEYNGQLTPYLKNLVDWVSRLPRLDSHFEPAFCDRPVLLCSASTGSSGGASAIVQARALFGYVGAVVLGDTVCIPNAQDCWDDALGFCLSEAMEQRMDEACGRLLRLARHFHQTSRQTPVEGPRIEVVA